VTNISYAKTTVFTFKGPEHSGDQRYIYVQKVLELALEKTKTEYGDYELKPTSENINLGRLLLQMNKGIYSNYFFKVSVTDELLDNFHVIRFPIDRGVSGYRIAFINKQRKDEFCPITNIEGLSNKIIVQGIGWLDSEILKYNGINVYALSNYSSMFEIVTLNRVDLFFRAINEIKSEYDVEHINYPDLFIEPCIALHYPLPRFFVTDKNNIENANRIEKGLKIAYEDGSFITLWEEYFLNSIELVNLQKRTLFTLENPFIQNLNTDYQKYNYSLLEKVTN
jgi:ABC-type amino acid transport substrate-binding protein